MFDFLDKYYTVQYCIVLYHIVLYCAVLHFTKLYSTVPYTTILYYPSVMLSYCTTLSHITMLLYYTILFQHHAHPPCHSLGVQNGCGGRHFHAHFQLELPVRGRCHRSNQCGSNTTNSIGRHHVV